MVCRSVPKISIHAPREEYDKSFDERVVFADISIHAPREGCDFHVECGDDLRGRISIHAPREGCDRGNGLRIPRYGHSDHSLASIVLYNPLASPQIRKSAESKYQQIIHS